MLLIALVSFKNSFLFCANDCSTDVIVFLLMLLKFI